MIKDIFRMSLAISLIKIFLRAFQYKRKRVLDIFNHSQLHKKYNIFSKILKAIVINSFLWRVSEIKEKRNKAALVDDSKFLQAISGTCKAWKERLIKAQASAAVNASSKFTEKIRSFPVKAISIITVTALLTNSALSVFFSNRSIGLLGWMVRTLFLILALAGLFCNAHWPEIKRTSLFLRYKNKY